MPVHNGERYLKESIESVLQQSFTDWELILVDDCSADGSHVLMEEYVKKDTRVQLITNQTNLGLPRSLNKGFSKARGEYLTWTSDDNLYDKEALLDMQTFLRDHPLTGLVYCDMYYINERGEPTGSVEVPPEALYYNDCIGACFLYKKEMLETIGGYDPLWALVEDYEYWIRISCLYKIDRIPKKRYYYRRHSRSLTGTYEEKIANQLFRLRMAKLPYLLYRADEMTKQSLFYDIWRGNPGIANKLQQLFFGEHLPVNLLWITRKEIQMDKKKIILYGAGDYGRRALAWYGAERVAYFADGDVRKTGGYIEEKRILSIEELKKIYKNYRVIISVDARKIPQVSSFLADYGITEFTTYLEEINYRKIPEEATMDIHACFDRAIGWIYKYTVSGKGIINNTDLRWPYPEVSGYIIPSLLNWGFRELAVSYGRWLCSIQKPDGSFFDTENEKPYIFDTAQVLKGLITLRDICPEVEGAIQQSAKWLVNHIQENGRMPAISENSWKKGENSELIHLYCLSPLIQAGFEQEARTAASYYIKNFREEILNFHLLSHFYAYVVEGLWDIGETELARKAMEKVAAEQWQDGSVPGYAGGGWICSTGLLQFALIWYKLGDMKHGNAAFQAALKLQNASGGWFGSYPGTSLYPDYFPCSEISWAEKYFLDALSWKCKREFEIQAEAFPRMISKEDGRYKIILREIEKRRPQRILDAGCGHGRYLKNLENDVPGIQLYGMDLSERVMEDIPDSISTAQGSLTCIPYPESNFDFVYAVESLEHAIAVKEAVRELMRVTAPGGEVVIIDKNISAMGVLEIDSWEQWFSDSFFEEMAEELGAELRIYTDISYDGNIQDGLFSCWILRKGKANGAV